MSFHLGALSALAAATVSAANDKAEAAKAKAEHERLALISKTIEVTGLPEVWAAKKRAPPGSGGASAGSGAGGSGSGSGGAGGSGSGGSGSGNGGSGSGSSGSGYTAPQEPLIYKTSPAPHLPDIPYLPPAEREPPPAAPPVYQVSAAGIPYIVQSQGQRQSQNVNQAQDVRVDVQVQAPQEREREPRTEREPWGWREWLAAGAALFVGGIVVNALVGSREPDQQSRR